MNTTRKMRLSPLFVIVLLIYEQIFPFRKDSDFLLLLVGAPDSINRDDSNVAVDCFLITSHALKC